jgi:CBS-domain-containing membrane protein
MIASIAVKLKGGGMAPPRPRLRHMAWSWAGAATAIGLTGALSSATATPWLMAPFGATAVLVFGLPDSPLAQPRNVIGGHLLTSLVGLVFLTALGPQWWSMALAVATAIAAMQMTRMVHPPAGANPLLIMATGASWSFLATPVLTGSVAIVLVALLCNNLAPERRYPMYWW